MSRRNFFTLLSYVNRDIIFRIMKLVALKKKKKKKKKKKMKNVIGGLSHFFPYRLQL